MITNTLMALGIVLGLMGYVTLKKELKVNRSENMKHWKSVEYSLEIKSNRTSKEVHEKSNFQDKALLQLAQNIAAVGYNIKSSKDSLEKTIEESKKDINNHTSKQVMRIIYLAPTLKITE